MAARAAGGAAEGTWLRAERQARGRGRQGRDWASEPGNLFASTVVRLRGGDPPAPTLALVAAVALQESLALFADGADIRIKWPNDLIVGDAKLSGILLERRDDAVVIGFGVNLRSAPAIPDRATTSIAALTGRVPDPSAVLNALATMFADWIACWRARGAAAVQARWLERAHAPGTPLSVRMGTGEVAQGTFAGLDANGALLLQEAAGMRTILAGDVALL